jgi:hypothetical protein
MPVPTVSVEQEQQQQPVNGTRADSKDRVAEVATVVALTYSVMLDYPGNDDQLTSCLAATMSLFVKTHPWLAKSEDELHAMLKELKCDVQPTHNNVDACIRQFTQSMRLTTTISCKISRLVSLFIEMAYMVVRKTLPPLYNLDRVCDEIWSHGEHLPATFPELDAMLNATTNFEARPAEVSQFLLKQILAGTVSVPTLCGYPAAKFIWIMATHGRNAMLTSKNLPIDPDSSRNDPLNIALRSISSTINAGLARRNTLLAAPPYELSEVETISRLPEDQQVSILAKYGAALFASACGHEHDRAMVKARVTELCEPLQSADEPLAKRMRVETVKTSAASTSSGEHDAV